MDSLSAPPSHQHPPGSGGGGAIGGGSKASSRSASPCRPRELVPPPAAAAASSTPIASIGPLTPASQQQLQQVATPQSALASVPASVTLVPSSASASVTPSSGFRPHHAKTLSHGSVESAKSQDGAASGGSSGQHRPSRHRSPTARAQTTPDTANTTTPPQTADDSTLLDESSALIDSSLLLSTTGGDQSDHASASFLSNGSGVLEQHAATGGSSKSQHQQQQPDDECDRVDLKTVTVLEQLRNKMLRVKDLMRTEQRLRDDNVNEYLKLASNADKQQVHRIKSVFEKKNQKSAQVISQLQKKLDSYQKRVGELEKHGLTQSHRPPREVLRDMGQGLKNVGGNIRDGITGFSGSVMSKPREFAHLIKNKFGSADNISQLSRQGGGATGAGGVAVGGATGSEGSSDQGDKAHGHAHAGHHQHGAHAHHHHGGSATLPATLHVATSQASMARNNKFPSDEGSECSSDSMDRYRPTDSGSQDAQFKSVYNQLHIKQLEIDSLKALIEELKIKLETMHSCENEINLLNGALQEEKYRRETLEEQVNDLTELHQNEVENLKQAMADMEEKVQYQSEERLRDIHEMLEHCQTKIQKMEHQALQQQQYVTLEGLDNSNARALVVKLINVLLTVLQVVLLLVATGAGIIMPFLRTRVRILTTVLIVLASVFILRQWPEVHDLGSHLIKRLKDMLDPVQ